MPQIPAMTLNTTDYNNVVAALCWQAGVSATPANALAAEKARLVALTRDYLFQQGSATVAASITDPIIT